LFADITENLSTILNSSSDERLIDMIIQACNVKAAIVVADEREAGLRRILNFGHTIGHAIELAAGMGTLRHGEAIAFGMLGAGLISCEVGGLPEADFYSLENAISYLPLPQLMNLPAADIYKYLQRDKKISEGNLHFVLLAEIGRAVVSSTVGTNLLQQTITELLRRYA
jgi:3-dehydroquinate synthase